MARFKVGQKVWMGRGEHLRELVVAKVHKNPLIPIHQYTFEAPNDGFACGEQSIRATKNGRDLKLSECFVDDQEAEFRINTIASAKRHIIDEQMEGFPKMKAFENTRVRFKPSMQMCSWIKDYANGRLIMHVDSGQGHFVRMMKMVRAKAVGIEPLINKEVWMEQRMLHDGARWDGDVNEVIAREFKDTLNIIKGLKDNVILVFTRPKRRDNLKLAIEEFMGKCEIWLIAKKTDSDLAAWEVLEHEGTSEDDEVIYSLKTSDE